MDELDQILLKAWNLVSKKVRENRLSALKRSRRQHKGVLTRPMREWCLVIRASDTRVNRLEIAVEPDTPSAEQDFDPIGAEQPHTLTLTGAAIRELTKPIIIPWPGVTYQEAAKILGREYKTMKVWAPKLARKKMLQIDRYREFRFPETKERGGIRGGRPYVWTPSPLDPNNFEGRAPHPVWGSLWQTLWMNLPEEHELTVKRVPKFRMHRGMECFRGWDFICPGRLNDENEYIGCGRACTYLYGPQTVWTLAKAINGANEAGYDMPDDSGLAGQWMPGVSDPIAEAARGKRSFACKTCWGVRSACMANRNGWNEFIAQISGGLLYGRDVPRPEEICPVVRKKREYSWPSKEERDETKAPCTVVEDSDLGIAQVS